MSDRLAALPSVDRVLRQPAAAALIEAHGRDALTDAVREAIDRLRGGIAAATDLSEAAVLASAAGILADWAAPTLGPVFNLAARSRTRDP